MSQPDTELIRLEAFRSRLAESLAAREKERAEVAQRLLEEFGATEIGDEVFSYLSGYRDDAANRSQELALVLDRVDSQIEDIHRAVEAETKVVHLHESNLQRLADSVANARSALLDLSSAVRIVDANLQDIDALVEELKKSIASDTSVIQESDEAPSDGSQPFGLRGGLTAEGPEEDYKS